MTPEQFQEAINQLLAVQRELQESQLRHQERMLVFEQNLTATNQTVDRILGITQQNATAISELIEVVRSHENRINRLEN